MRPGSPALDRFRLLAAVLVVAVHTSPLTTYSVLGDFWLTRVLGRVAVPFFLMVTGHFLAENGWRNTWTFWKKTALLYGLCILLYLPLNLYAGQLDGDFLRLLVTDGTFYHLWYFPALILGACIVWALVRGLGRWAWIPAGLLYVLGVLGDSWYGLTAALPPLRAAYEAMFLCFDYTRNGLFSVPIFLLLGGRLAGRPRRHGAPACGALLLLSMALLTGEGLLVKALELPRFDALYFSLPLCVGFLLLWLAALELPPVPALRGWTAAVYILHPWCIVLVRGGAEVLGLEGPLVENSMGHFLAVLASSAAASWALWLAWSRRPLKRSNKG